MSMDWNWAVYWSRAEVVNCTCKLAATFLKLVRLKGVGLKDLLATNLLIRRAGFQCEKLRSSAYL